MDADEKEDEASQNHESQPHTGSTLLPSPIANAISLVTRSSSLYLRLGTFIGGLALDGARVTTLTGLELSRAVVEGILSRAGRDVTSRSIGELGRADAEGLLERSIATLHSTITTISFAASAGFHISSTALASAGDASQHLLTALDSILGSTDSSRAIASIITLIRREFDNPATGQPGETVGVADLLMGICGLALLQRWCKKMTDLEIEEKHLEDVVWDVVILNDGSRADVVGSSNTVTDLRTLENVGGASQAAGLFMPTSGNEELLQTIQRRGSGDGGSLDEWPEAGLKEHIMQTLPPDASVSIATETTTTKTITVEIIGTEPPDLSPPPGVEIIEETAHHTGEVDLNGEVLTNEQKIGLLIPKYRVVYRLVRNRMRSTHISAGGEVFESEEPQEAHKPRMTEPSKASTSRLSLDLTEVASPSSAKFSLSPPSSPELEKPELPSRFVDETPKIQSETSIMMNSGILETTVSNSANQKRLRKPMSASSSISGSEASTRKTPSTRPSLPKKVKSDASSSTKNSASEKKGSIRNALRKGSGVALSNLWNKDGHVSQPSQVAEASKTHSKPHFSVSKSTALPKPASSSQLPVPQRGSVIPARDAPRAPQRGNPNFFSSRDLGMMKQQEIPRSPSRASYYSVHERRRDSIVSQTDTFSIHSSDTRPGSPTAFRTHLKAQSNLLRAKSEKNIVNANLASPTDRAHRRAKSHVPSIYTLKTNTSETSLILAPHVSKGAYHEQDALNTLSRTGIIDGLFPAHHLVRNITRFVRFASASYGASFMRVMGIGKNASVHATPTDHHEHHSFSTHTQLPASAILLSSFVDPQGGTDSSGQTNTGVPMVHFISLDHESKAVVMTCRGTLGFEDVLTDMTCDYDDMFLRGKTYKVHKGMYASAMRLLSGEGSKVMVTLKAALEEFPEYGLVMCGHSLGGAVTALLAIMISEPNPVGFSFITSSETYQRASLQITASSSTPSLAPQPQVQLPAGRPIHVYAYGPPATLSPSLRLSTRGLITTIVNGQDLVPYLSLGVLHDLQAIALAFKTDDSGAKGEVRARVWAGLTNSFADKWYGGREPTGGLGQGGDDQWAYSALKTLRASMLSTKLVPPGEVFRVDTSPVLQRDAFVAHPTTASTTIPVEVTAGMGIGSGIGPMGMGRGLGRPATRAELRFVRDVEKRFGEIRFGGSMLLDHSPGRYEAALEALGRGVLG